MKKRGTVLVIDDEPTVFDALQICLKDQHDLVYAHNGTEGLISVRSAMPDLILLDIGMPDINGHELCRMLKADTEMAHIPVIFLTAFATASDEAQGLAVGAVDYIAKPIHPAIVKARVATHMELKLQRDYLSALVRMDGLTNITNRRGFDEVLDREWRRAARARLPLSLVMMDIDAFKRYNDNYGHTTGDDCLKTVVNSLKTVIHRGGDTLTRYGGEEFAAILFDTPFEFIGLVAERFRVAVEAAGIPHAYSAAAPVVTISAGAATIVPDHRRRPMVMVEAADQALYEVKRNGGNGIRVRQLENTLEEPPILLSSQKPTAASG